ncbi:MULTISPECIES: MFS transporter [Gordonia]|uniref:MFS transporter n=1 Tax=unclassified Gordonia (in: high G+C Gram-positive bacteria) TaxID=2657482 RepID=UPI0009EF2E01|nr:MULTISPECIES: MFS transporter [unclassified Gordonia (in: high G+C Gram-positive bacteria)]
MTRARGAVSAIFCLNGFLAALWVAHIPVITAHTETSHEQLGGLLLLLGGSAFVGMQVSGHALDRYGSRTTTLVAATLLCPVMIGPAVASNTGQLAVALALFGFVNGSLDVSMNAQAVAVERAYRRPIMSSFHGFFSLGGLAGSLVVAATLWAQVGVVATVGVSSLLGLILVAVCARSLVAPDGGGLVETTPSNAAGPTVDDESTAKARWWHGLDLRRLAVLAAVAFALMLAEGTAYDWSALQIVEDFGTRDAVGAVAFGAFSAAMTIARFGIDPIAARLGPVWVVRAGSALGICGITLAIFAPEPIIAIVGWTIFGVGLAGLIPQIFTAAGNLTASSSGRAISTVVGCGYLGMLSGPAIVGFIAGHSGVSVGLTPVIGALVFALVAARVVRPAARPVSRRDVRDTLEG